MDRRIPVLERLLEPVITGLGYELWGLELLTGGKSPLLRVYIDAPDGIGVDDCGRVSHQVSGVLEVENPIHGAYTLEVSSPGLDRKLFRPEQYERFAGSRARVQLRELLEGHRRITGTLAGIEDGKLLIESDGNEYLVPFDLIDKARLVPG